MAAVGVICCVGGPALMYYVTPSEGELFNRFSPELQASNLANRARRQRDYEDFLGKLKEYSKSDKPIWEAAADAQRKEREELIRRTGVEEAEKERRREELRREAVGR
ncbi:hypothetical protein GJ744_008875 [Endocarpon pusillum]|uniref:Cytochrome b mRNA-processing protein 4 n=1 Tax=Endocarpon pusillum TaxID=364733 RepID=A0A8H7EBA3_9EURO|nr:hypothetical protein GJ744_008875 [Endocarpon pusillum]